MQIPAAAVAAVALRERRRGDTRTTFPTFAVGFDLYASHETRGPRSLWFIRARGALESGEVGKLWVERLPRRETRSGGSIN